MREKGGKVMHKLRRGLFSLTALIILLAGYNFICIAEESAEKGPAEIGDILYYSYGNQWFPGHAMLYVGWYPVREPKKENLRVVESMPPSEINRRGLVNESTNYIYDYARTWKEGLSAEQRRKISEFVISKTGLWRYCDDTDHTYQKGQDGIHCDCAGLCEAAYESIGLDPVPREGWILWPEEQCISSRMKPATPVPPKIRLEPSDEGTLKAYASDEDKGSGITKVEFWDGKPDDTPDNYPGKRLGWDDDNADIGDYYTYYHGGTVTNLYAKAFDQAGNTKVTVPLEDTFVSRLGPDDNYHTYQLVILDKGYYKPDDRHIAAMGLYSYPEGYTTLHLFLVECYGEEEYGEETQSSLDIAVYEVDTTTFKISEVTWNTKPDLGRLVGTYTWPYVNGRDGVGTWVEIDITGTAGVCLVTPDLVNPGYLTTNEALIISTNGSANVYGNIYTNKAPYLTK